MPSEKSALLGPGKIPSTYNYKKNLIGFPGWPQHQATAKDIDRWGQEPDYGLSVQARQSGVRAADIDVENPVRAQRIVDHIDRVLPWHIFPRRTRPDSGKLLLPFRFDTPMGKRTIPVEGGIIEFLGDGQQWLAAGTHTGGQRYTWEGGLPAAFPLLDLSDFDTLWESLVRAFNVGAPPTIAREKRSIADMDLDVGDDPVASWLMANWEIYDGEADGRLHIVCPFAAEHTSESGSTATVYAPAGTGGYEQGHFICLHAHCAGRGDSDFLDATGYLASQFPDLAAERYIEVEEEAGGTALVAVEHRGRPRFAHVVTATGEIPASARNLRLAIEREDYIGHWIAHETFRDQLVWAPADVPRSQAKWRAFEDVNYVDLRITLEELAFKPGFGKEMLRDVIKNVARRNRIDLAQEWLARQVWDGVPRVERFMTDYMGCEDTPYARAVSLYAWTAHAGRVAVPGIQADMVIALEGDQGARKTSALQAIAPHEEMYVTMDLDVKDDDLSRQMRGKLVGELEELRGLHSRAAGSIKAWISRRFEAWVPKYEERENSYGRRLVIWATHNSDETGFLADSTGERRWLPIRIGERMLTGFDGKPLLAEREDGKIVNTVHVDMIRRDRAQLWAEGAALFKEKGILFGKAESLAVLEHEKYAIVDLWEPALSRWAYHGDEMAVAPVLRPEGITIADALTGALGISLDKADRGKEMRAAKVLKALGFKRRQVTIEGERLWRYVFGEGN